VALIATGGEAEEAITEAKKRKKKNQMRTCWRK